MSSPTLHITHGDAANHFLQMIGVQGDFLSWDDVMHLGPLVSQVGLHQLSELRANFLHSLGWGTRQRILDKFNHRDQRFLSAIAETPIIIWNSFELFDQLHLLQICDWLYHHRSQDTDIKVVFVNDYIGSQNISKQSWIDMSENAQPLTFGQIALSHQLWQALCEKTPEALVELIHKENLDCLPFARSGLQRFVEELPGKKNGLSRTEVLILKSLRKENATLKSMFQFVCQKEPVSFLGDLAFLAILDELINSQCQLIAPDDRGPFDPKSNLPSSQDWQNRVFYLTEDGEDVLTGQKDWLSEHEIDKWWAGVHLTPTNDWRWDKQSNQVIDFSRHLRKDKAQSISKHSRY